MSQIDWTTRENNFPGSLGKIKGDLTEILANILYQIVCCTLKSYVLRKG